MAIDFRRAMEGYGRAGFRYVEPWVHKIDEFTAKEPLAAAKRVLADSGISIDAMVQKEPSAGEEQVDIIMLTHLTVERSVNVAIARIEKLPVVVGSVTRIRMEQLGTH